MTPEEEERVGVLRLRSEDRRAILATSLSMAYLEIIFFPANGFWR
jgi:hypothetical protein